MPMTPARLHPFWTSAFALSLSFALPLYAWAQGGERRQQSKFRSAIISWEAIKELPPPPQQERHLGQAGVFAGAYDQTMIIGGGANFPSGHPWEGGPKLWWDDISVLQRSINQRGTAVYAWEESTFNSLTPSPTVPRPASMTASCASGDATPNVASLDATSSDGTPRRRRSRRPSSRNSRDR